jgi:hypothetical protein
VLANVDQLHGRPPQQIPRCQWYIHVEVAITEICGWSHD